MGNEVEQTAKALADAEAAVTKAEEALEAERRRVEEARQELADLDAKILELPPDDAKGLSRLDGQRTAVRVGLEVVQRARLPRAEGALREARATRDAAELVHKQTRHRALATQFEEQRAEIERFADAAEARLEELLRAHQALELELLPLGAPPHSPWTGLLARAGAEVLATFAAWRAERAAVHREAVREDQHERWLREQRVKAGKPADPMEEQVQKWLREHAENEASAARRAAGERTADTMPPGPPAPGWRREG